MALQEEGERGGEVNSVRPHCKTKLLTTIVLGFLADNRPLSVMEYDKLIRYFAMRREGVLRMEYGENIPPR